MIAFFPRINCGVDFQVKAVGSGKADDKGNVVKSSLSVGDTVLYSKYTGVEFEV